MGGGDEDLLSAVTLPTSPLCFVDQDSLVGRANRYGWTVRRWNPGQGEIFRTYTDRP